MGSIFYSHPISILVCPWTKQRSVHTFVSGSSASYYTQEESSFSGHLVWQGVDFFTIVFWSEMRVLEIKYDEVIIAESFPGNFWAEILWIMLKCPWTLVIFKIFQVFHSLKVWRRKV